MDLAEKWARIGLDRNYSALDLDGLNPDLQGWGSRHRIFEQVICEEKPQLVIEVGTWKGASLVHMAKLAGIERYALAQRKFPQVAVAAGWLSHHVSSVHPQHSR